MDRKRIRRACARCRRQKLKCDNARPCPLCVHASAECIDATERTRRSNRIPRSGTYSSLHSPNVSRGQCPDPMHVATLSTLAEPGPSPISDEANSVAVTPSEGDGAVDEFGLATPQGHTSAIHLVEKIFRKYHYRDLETPVNAIPDGASGSTPSHGVEGMSVKELIGVNLPTLEITNALLDVYVESMHWYLTLFHEPTLRARLQPILITGRAYRQQKSFLLLVLIVLITAVRSTDTEKQQRVSPDINFRELECEMQEVVERWFLPCGIEENTSESIAYCFLMSSNYLMTSQTRSAYYCMSSTIRAALSCGLNDDSRWEVVSPIDKEVRRRLWWSIVMGAGFIAMSFGKPPLITESDCRVSLPRDLDDNSATCPGFASLEEREDGEIRTVTLASSNRYKARLHLIAISITKDIYFHRDRSAEHLVKTINAFYQRLIAWERMVPPELRPASHVGKDWTDPVSLAFSRQAVTLQISYDNIQLFLFRPLVSLDRPITASHSLADFDFGRFLKAARQQCWISAIRTSRIGQFLALLQSIRKSPACPHIGVHAFTAGVILGLQALSGPLSPKSQACKHGIAKLIQIPRQARFDAPIWIQLTAVLTDLMHVIAAAETKALIGGQEPTQEPDEPELIIPPFGTPQSFYSRPEGTSIDLPSSQCTQQSSSDFEARGFTHEPLMRSSLDRFETSIQSPIASNSYQEEQERSAIRNQSDRAGLGDLHATSGSRPPFPPCLPPQYPDFLNNTLGNFDQTWLWEDFFNI